MNQLYRKGLRGFQLHAPYPKGTIPKKLIVKTAVVAYD
jgi:hypothetical protein